MTDIQKKMCATISANSFPEAETQANRLLFTILDGKAYKRDELDKALQLNGNIRSALQVLEGDPYYWNILRVPYDSESAKRLQLNPLHLSGDPEQDVAARLERYKAFKQVSCKQAIAESERLPKAIKERSEAEKAYYSSKQAANDDQGGEL